jgi:hypothetical protein
MINSQITKTTKNPKLIILEIYNRIEFSIQSPNKNTNTPENAING